MADLQVKTANICKINSRTTLYSNAGGSGTYIADNSISVHMASGNAASGIYASPLPEPIVAGDKYTISFIPICTTNTTFIFEFAGVQRLITFTSGIRKSVTIQASTNNRNIAFYGGDGVEKTIIIEEIQIEKGETATPYRPYSATGWLHSLRKLTTATEIIIPPTTIYADGSNITTYTIKGNTVQNGTPTPSAPIAVQCVGELDSGQYKIPISSGQQTTNIYLDSTQTVRQIKQIVFTGNEQFTNTQIEGGYRAEFKLQDYIKSDAKHLSLCSHFPYHSNWAVVPGFVPNNAATSLFFQSLYSDFAAYCAQQYANGTPVCVWYVLATPETAAVNEPLMKIGTYADTLSNAASIPTTEGANSITVDTAVQPSEFTATWTGWHDASVQEWDGSQWNE